MRCTRLKSPLIHVFNLISILSIVKIHRNKGFSGSRLNTNSLSEISGCWDPGTIWESFQAICHSVVIEGLVPCRVYVRGVFSYT